jgi:wyosine [tRNA(Phe)-imidazoG37] synthetase (radical SAM superfamily)
MIAFKQSYQGSIWVEIMMVHELNDTEAALQELAAVILQIDPDEVHINQPIRPPTESWVQPTDEEGLLRARAILGEKARFFTFPEGDFDLGPSDDVVEAILAIITRHPMRKVELERTLEKWGKEEVNQALRTLHSSGRAQNVERYGIQFWSSATSYFPNGKNQFTPEVDP